MGSARPEPARSDRPPTRLVGLGRSPVRHRQHLRPGEPAVGSRARLVITAITTQGLTQAEAARTYGLSQAWVSRLMAGYRVEGEAAFEPRSRRPKAASPRALPVEVRDLILRLRKKLGDAGLDAGPDTIAWHLEHHHGRGHLPLDHQPTPGSRGTGGRRAGMTGRGNRAVSSDSPRATSPRMAAARRSGRSVRGSRSGPSSRARTA
jgi:hypothetical protein